MENLESSNRWRLKAAIIIMIVFFFVLGAVRACLADTWLNVASYKAGLGAAPAGCAYWIEEIKNGSLKTYRVWQRCTDGTAFSTCQSSGCYLQSVTGWGVVCGGGSSVVSVVDNYSYYCTGSVSYVMSCIGIMTGPQDGCVGGHRNNFGNSCTLSTGSGADCRSYDVLLHTFSVIEDTCSYDNLAYVSGGNYQLLIAGASQNCNACTPDGTIMVGNDGTDGSSNVPCDGVGCNGRPAGTYTNCSYKSIVGDPTGESNTTTASGGGAADPNITPPPPPDPVITPIGGSTGGSTSTDSGGNTTTTTSSPIGGSGGGSGGSGGFGGSTGSYGTGTSTGVTTTTTYSGSSGTGTSTSTTYYPDAGSPGTYTNGQIEAAGVGDFGGLFVEFANHVKTSPLIAHFDLHQMATSIGSGSSIITLNTHKFGNMTIDLSAGLYGDVLRYMRGMAILSGCVLMIRAVIMKR